MPLCIDIIAHFMTLRIAHLFRRCRRNAGHTPKFLAARCAADDFSERELPVILRFRSSTIS